MTIQNEPDELNELYDVEIDTLGLVTQGANRETFVLLKSLDGAEIEGDASREHVPPQDALSNAGPMPLESTGQSTEVSPSYQPQVQKEAIPATPEEVNGTLTNLSQPLWRRVIGIFKRALEHELEADHEQTIMDEAALSDGNAAEVTEEEARVGKHVPRVAPDAQSSQLPANFPGLSAANLEVTTPSVVGLSKQEAQAMENEIEVTRNAPVEKSAKEVELEKSVADLLARVEKAEQDAARERDARERATWIQKAANMPLGLPTEEFATHMHWLAKTNATEAQWFESAFNAISKQLEDSNLFIEKGTQRIPEEMDLVGKANALIAKGEAKSFADALLSLPAADQAAYLAKRRKAVKDA